MHRSLLRSAIHHYRHFSSSPSIPALYSFLQPSIFPLHQNPNPQNPKSQSPPSSPSPQTQSSLESSLLSSLQSLNTDLAWKTFKSLTSLSLLPSSPSLTNSLISHLASLPDRLSLKRAFVSSVYVLEKSPNCISVETFASLFRAFRTADTLSPALSLFKAMLKNRCFVPFSLWGLETIEMAKKNDVNFRAFLTVFHENCRVAIEERIEYMRPDLGSCNVIIDSCCRILESISDAEKVLDLMSSLGLEPDLNSFGSLAYLYALKGNEQRIYELDKLMDALGFCNKEIFFTNLIHGYVKSCRFELASSIILRTLKERKEEEFDSNILDENTYNEIVNSFIKKNKTEKLAALIIQSQEIESSFSKPTNPNCSVGFGIMNACVELGHLDKAHKVLDEMSLQNASIGLGVYSCILKAYCKEQRTAEAAQLVAEINTGGLQLDSPMYDTLIDASMTCQDFQSAFSLFEEMREARLPDLKTSYLTIMTGLTENNRPELMASFLDEIISDPRIEIQTHDWNSIIHAFCKVGRFEDAKRTYRRMIFLRFEPNNQTYLSLINGYVSCEKYFNVLMLWTEVRRNEKVKFDNGLIDAFLYGLIKGGFFDAVMQVVEKANEMKIFVDKWRHKQAFMEKHKKLKVAKLRRKNYRKMEALVAFKNWAGLN
ncbi:hypothetical protein LUZ60_015630 [Juncus effusus]|nr:hypothetical protein LUZ60_015630 [Juncus effusus]